MDQNAAVSPIGINQHIREFQEKMKIQGGMSKKDWAFWNTQPVPKLDEVKYIWNSDYEFDICCVGNYRGKYGAD